MEKLYFQKKDGGNLTRKDYSILCIRFACESRGCPVFGPFNNQIFEFNKPDLTESRRKVLEQAGYTEISQPTPISRNTLSEIALSFA